MRGRLGTIIITAVLGVALLAGTPALAAPPDCTSIKPGESFGNVLRRVACGAGYIRAGDVDVADETRLVEIVGTFVSVALAFTGVVFVVLMVYGGYLWMTAQGNEEQVGEAQKLIRNAVLGIIVVFAAFTVSYAVLLAVNSALTPRLFGA
jgi:hypothetical protein